MGKRWGRYTTGECGLSQLMPWPRRPKPTVKLSQQEICLIVGLPCDYVSSLNPTHTFQVEDIQRILARYPHRMRSNAMLNNP